jgi:hypothetical protein
MRKEHNLTKKEIIAKVDEFVKKMGWSDERLGLKNADTKILYYYNFIDERNALKGFIELSSQYFIRLINFLCKGEEKLKEYIDNFYDSEDLTFGITKFKKHIESTRNLTINGETLQKQIDSNKWEEFWEDLQQLFLDPTDIYWLSSFKERIAEGLTGIDIFKWYQKKGGRLGSIITFPVNYVKETVNK